MIDLRDLVTRMARAAIRDHGSDRRTMSGMRMRSSLAPVAFVRVTLPPDDMFSVALDPSLIPTEVDGVPLRISEGPAKVNKPSGRYMLSVVAHWDDAGTFRGSTGRVCLR